MNMTETWISVETELPKEDKPILFYGSSVGDLSFIRLQYVGLYCNIKGKMKFRSFGKTINNVTHWMNLPENPNP